MSGTIRITCTVDTTDPQAALGFEAWIDDELVADIDHVTGPQHITLTVSDDDSQHSLRFCLKNKTTEHTTIDESGAIVRDSLLTLKNICFDDIRLGQVFTDVAVYTHDCNGTAPMSQNKFYGNMGCNGTVELQFTTPIYLWLLEHM